MMMLSGASTKINPPFLDKFSPLCISSLAALFSRQTCLRRASSTCCALTSPGARLTTSSGCPTHYAAYGLLFLTGVVSFGRSKGVRALSVFCC